jgi:hypothetical protein
MDEAMIDFLQGALMACYLVAAVFFFRFWHRTAERLFASFAVAFLLLAVEQTARLMLGIFEERHNYMYVLRIIGFFIILYAIIDKNIFTGRRPKP